MSDVWRQLSTTANAAGRAAANYSTGMVCRGIVFVIREPAPDHGNEPNMGLSMCCHNPIDETATVRGRSGDDRRRIVSALIAVIDQQDRIWQQCRRLSDQLRLLDDENTALFQLRARLADELQALRDPPELPALTQPSSQLWPTSARDFFDPGS